MKLVNNHINYKIYNWNKKFILKILTLIKKDAAFFLKILSSEFLIFKMFTSETNIFVLC